MEDQVRVHPQLGKALLPCPQRCMYVCMYARVAEAEAAAATVAVITPDDDSLTCVYV